MFLMRFKKSSSKNSQNFWSKKIFKVWKFSGNFRKFLKIFNWNPSKIFKFWKSIFSKISENFQIFKIFENFRKMFPKKMKLSGIFSIKHFANFLMNFFLNLIRNIWFIRIIEPFSTIPRCVYMRWHRVRLCFSLFFTTNHQKGLFFEKQSFSRLQPQNPTRNCRLSP